MFSIFSVSRQDIYDYLRCPKIVSLKTYKNSKKLTPKPKVMPNRNIRQEIGTIGEVLTQRVFSDKTEKEVLLEYEQGFDTKGEEYEEEIDEISEPSSFISEELVKKQLLPPIKVDLENRGVELDSQMKEVLKDTITGLSKIKKYLQDQYGQVRIIGHGESRNGLLPNKIRPDFVATVENQKKPILIEVKNTEVTNVKADHFQASFYNTIGREFGVTIIEERVESNFKTILPRTVTEKISETLLVYPRQGRFEKIVDDIKIDKKIVDDVWRAKQLGIKGQSPKTDCGSSCPHHRHGELPEGNLETAIPLPLIYSKGWIEQKKDLDIKYLKGFLWRKGIGEILDNGLFEIDQARFEVRMRTGDQEQRQKNFDILDKQKEKFLEDMSKKLGFSKDLLERITSRDFIYPNKENKILEKEMANELKPWKELLGDKKFKLLKNAAKGNATKLYPLPDKSENFVKKSWKEWD